MKFCPNCGTELKPEARFCTACGTPIPVETPPAADPEPQTQSTSGQPDLREQAREASNAFKETLHGNSNIVQRVTNIMLRPRQEWLVIETEQPNITRLIGGYALVLAMIPALASVLKYGILGYNFLGLTTRNLGTGIQQGLTHLIGSLVGVYLLAWVINELAPSFESPKNFGRSLQLAVYCYTPQWLAGILILFSTKLNMIIFVVSLYAIYLLATGIPVLKETPKEKVTGYVALTIIAMIVIGLLVGMVLAAILGIFFVSRMAG